MKKIAYRSLLSRAVGDGRRVGSHGEQSAARTGNWCVTAVAVVGLLAGLAVATSGCGSGNRLSLVPVHGTVTYQGKPLGHGRVVFVPQEGTPGPRLAGIIKSDGSYHIRTTGRDGAVIGKYIVTVHRRTLPATPEEKENRWFVGKPLIPFKYFKERESGLSFEVKKGDNEYNIELE